MLEEYCSSDQESNHSPNSDFQQEQPMGPGQGAVTSAVRQTITNLAYNLKHSSLLSIPLLQRKAISIRDDKSLVQMLGKSYDFQTNDAFLKRFQKTIWLSYREGIEKIQGDAGWGCMIRVVQMMLAEILRRHRGLQPTEIVEYFKEGSDAPFSLLNICQIGRINHRWTGLIEIFSIVKQLFKKNDYSISVDMYSSGLNIPDYDSFIEISKGEKIGQRGKVVIIENRFKGNCIPQDCHDHFFHLMKHETFCGISGGLSGQALYIIGNYDQQLIVMDPHYVQKADSNNYFKKTPRGLPISRLCSSVAFCYYFKDQDQYLDWVSWIIHANIIYQGFTVFDVQVENLQVWRSKLRKQSDDDFEMLTI